MEIRPCKPEEYAQGLAPIWQFFGSLPNEDTLARWEPLMPAERLLAAWDGDLAVGGAGAFPFRLSIPGGEIDVAGVTVVGVSPTHRRRGILRQLMRAQLDAAHERGEAVAALWASEGGIYGRFGYGMASLGGEIDVARAHSALRGAPVPGAQARQVELEEALRLFPPLYDAARMRRPGMPSRTEDWWRIRRLDDPEWSRDGGGIQMRVVLELDGVPSGYALYRHHQRFEAGSSVGKVHVIEALGVTPAATQEVWRYLFGVDWVSRLTAGLLPVDHELLHLVVEPRRLHLRSGDALWIRLVDVGAALSARSYTGEGEVVFEVTDEVCPWNEGRWRLANGVCARDDDAEPDLRLPVQELGATYLGGFSFAQLAAASRIEELRPQALTRADVLFATAAKPWTPEIF
jgi:predicted acetyltransferase